MEYLLARKIAENTRKEKSNVKTLYEMLKNKVTPDMKEKTDNFISLLDEYERMIENSFPKEDYTKSDFNLKEIQDKFDSKIEELRNALQKHYKSL
jgi:hypothetical protein